jgi:exodeoxyribonuclease VII large subunit
MVPRNPLAPTSAISVGGLTAYLKALIEDNEALQHLWVMGEVSSSKSHPKGLFFTLTDPDSGDSLPCVAWGGLARQLQAEPRAGETVLVLGHPTLWTKRGNYQFQVVQCLAAGRGLKALQRQRLEARLEAEGVFDPELHQPIPAHPQCIAVVTSPQAAAWGDIQRTLSTRYPGLRVLLSPCTVQGEDAPVSIARAIARVVSDGRAEVLILSRGGGAREDLACFDDECVVRAIADCPIPVIAGIGHDQDLSLADRAADLHVHTPTAAALAAVPALQDLQGQVRFLQQQLLATLQSRLQTERATLNHLRQRLNWPLLRQQMNRESHYLDQLRQQMTSAARWRLGQEQQRCRQARQLLDSLNPQHILERGYALVRAGRDCVASVEDLRLDQTLNLQLADGHAIVRVEHLEAKPDRVKKPDNARPKGKRRRKSS